MYHGLLNLMIHGLQPIIRLILLASFIIGLWLEYQRRKRTPDDKKTLQELNRLLTLIESGNSPRYSLEQVDIRHYPDYLSHPKDDYFNPAIFKRQVELFEKTILVQSELDAEFSIVRYRMSLMKFLPIGIMLGLQQFMGTDPGIIGLGIVLGFLISYYVAEAVSRA